MCGIDFGSPQLSFMQFFVDVAIGIINAVPWMHMLIATGHESVHKRTFEPITGLSSQGQAPKWLCLLLGLDLSEQAMGWIPLMFGIGSGR